MGEEMVQALIISATAMMIVFAVLIGLAYSFSLMKLFAGVDKDLKKNEIIGVDDLDELIIEESIIETDVSDDKELVAVISAALALYMDGVGIVSSIRRVEDTSSWSKLGIQEQMMQSQLG